MPTVIYLAVITKRNIDSYSVHVNKKPTKNMEWDYIITVPFDKELTSRDCMYIIRDIEMEYGNVIHNKIERATFDFEDARKLTSFAPVAKDGLPIPFPNFTYKDGNYQLINGRIKCIEVVNFIDTIEFSDTSYTPPETRQEVTQDNKEEALP